MKRIVLLLLRAQCLLSLLISQNLLAAYAQAPNSYDLFYSNTGPSGHFRSLEIQYDFFTDLPPPRPIPEPCSELARPLNQGLNWLDRTHLNLSQRVCNSALRFDRFFGDIRYQDDYATSFVRIRNSFVIEKEESALLKFQPRIRARIHLPNAKQRFNLLISEDSLDENTLSTSSEVLNQQENEPTRYTTTLRWIARKSDDWELDLDIGSRFNSGIQTFIRARVRKDIVIDAKSQWRVLQTVFWRDEEGFGERTKVDYERQITLDTLFRWTNYATFSEETQGVAWTQRVTLFQQLDFRRAISYTFGTTGETRPDPEINNYGFSIRFRKNIHSHWLFVEVEPEVNWPLELDRKLTPQMTFRIEAQFGRK